MTVEIRGKNEAIQALIERVQQAPVGARVRIVDRWDADAAAVGFEDGSGSGRTLYVSVWRQPDGQVYWSLESSSGDVLGEGTGDVPSFVSVLDKTFPQPTSKAV